MAPEIWSSAIQALGTIVAALAGVLLWKLQDRRAQDAERAATERERQKREQDRRQRALDMLVAIRAELGVMCERTALQFGSDVAEEQEKKLLERLRDDRERQDAKDMPQGPATDDNFIFDDLKEDLGLISWEVIDPIVRAYRYDASLNRLINSFDEGMYDELSDERQAEAVKSYFRLGAKTLVCLLKAKKELDVYLVNNGIGSRWSSSDEQLLEVLDQRNDRA